MTHEEYMNNASGLPLHCKERDDNHHAYYVQFATPGIRHYVESNYTKEQIIDLYEKDKNLNNLPSGWLRLFDTITACYSHELNAVYKALGERIKTMQGGYVVRRCTPSDGCCAIKAYMRDWAGISK